MVFQKTPKPCKKTPKSGPEASKRYPKWSLLPPQNTLWAPYMDEPEKNTKIVSKQAPKGTPKMLLNSEKNTKKCFPKVTFKKDCPKVSNWTPPDVQNYGFRARGASIFTISRDT